MAIERVQLLKPIEYDHNAQDSVAGLVVQAIVNGRATISPLENGLTILVELENKRGERLRISANAQDDHVSVFEVMDKPFLYACHRFLAAFPYVPEFIASSPLEHDPLSSRRTIQAVLFDRKTSIIGDMLR